MQRHILVKHIHHIQLGHLYEHIFCTTLTEKLRSNGLYPYVDYYLNAHTYYAGYIVLDFAIYNARVKAIVENLNTISPKFDSDALSGAVLQIISEKLVDTESFDEHRIIDEMNRIQMQDWAYMESIDLLTPALEKKNESDAIYNLKYRAPRNFLTLTQNISIKTSILKQNEKTYMPLFAIISRAINDTLQDVIADYSYCYSYDDDFYRGKQKYTMSNYYRIDKRQATILQDEAENTSGVLSHMLESGFIEKLSDYLSKDSVSIEDLPNIHDIVAKTGMVVGPKTWARIGTKNNIQNVFENMIVDFKLGKSRQRVDCSTLFLKH